MPLDAIRRRHYVVDTRGYCYADTRRYAAIYFAAADAMRDAVDCCAWPRHTRCRHAMLMPPAAMPAYAATIDAMHIICAALMLRVNIDARRY